MKYKYLKRIGISHNDILYTLYNSNLIKPYIDYTGYRLKYPTINLYVDNSIIYSNIFYYTVMNVGYMLTSFVLQFKYFNDKNEEMIRLTNKNEKNSDENICSICLTDKSEYIINPCGHYCIFNIYLGICEKCNDIYKDKKCQICREDIISIIKVYK